VSGYNPETREGRLNPIPSDDFTNIVIDLRCNDIRSFDYSTLQESFAYDGKRSTSPELLPQEDGLFFALPTFLDIEESGMPNRIDFKAEPSLSIGREDSRHKVFFGDLNLIRFSGDDEKQRVAVKPYVTLVSERYLAQELAMYQQLRAAGVDHPEEIGILKAGKYYFAISRFQPEIITQDSLDWASFDQESVESNIGRALDGMVELHGNGLSHGDAHPRNITVQPEATSYWHVDLEHGIGFKNSEDTLLGIKQDLREYFKGLADKDLLGVNDTYENFIGFVFEPYQMRVLKMQKGPQKVEITKLLPLICEELRREYEGEPVSVYERKENLKSLEKSRTSPKKPFCFRKHK